MKQHITKEQVYELDEKQYYKYLDYFQKMKSMVGSLVYFEPVEDDKLLPCMSIGQMIEFLDEQNPLGKGFGTVKGTNGLTMYWVVNQYDKTYKKEELCDALWEAVKEMLK